jgi:hypothetical protein
MTSIMDPIDTDTDPKQGRRKQTKDKAAKAPMSEGRKSMFRGIVIVALIIFSGAMLIVANGRNATVNTAEDIGAVYDHAVVLQVREGDTLETAAAAVFPNTLLESRLREGNLKDEAKALELDRYQAEWLRLSRLLTGTTGTQLAAGEFIAVPAKEDEPGAIEADRVSTEITRLTKAYAEATTPAGG